MTDTVKQSEVNDAIWAACDTFRGVVDAGSYKDYILVALFLKYVTDVWNDHRAAYAREFADLPEDQRDIRIERRMRNERFQLPVIEIKDEAGAVVDRFHASFDSLKARKDRANIGELFNIVLEHIEDANKKKLDGVFRNIDFNSESNLGKPKDRARRLRHLIDDFSKPALDLRPSRVSEDVIGEAYIYLISKFASDAGKKAGEFYTPSAVSALLARLAAPEPGQTVCDPACGSGSLLIRAAEQVPADGTGRRDVALFGQEVNGQTWALARMNMFLHGADAADIRWCDTLNDPQLIAQDGALSTFDVVVANPPFSLDKWGADAAPDDQFKRYWRADGAIPPRSKGDYAFITHMIEIARRRAGRVAVIVPHGVLFRAGAEGKIREALIRENLLDAVIGLPANMFATTGIPVAILVFNRRREQGGPLEDRRDVLFIDASREFEPGKTVNVMTETHANRIVETFSAREAQERYSHLATLEEIAENDFNLNIPRYVDTFEAEEEIDVAGVQKEIAGIEAELDAVRAKMAACLKELGVDA